MAPQIEHVLTFAGPTDASCACGWTASARVILQASPAITRLAQAGLRDAHAKHRQQSLRGVEISVMPALRGSELALGCTA